MNFWLILTPLFSALLGWFLTWILLKTLFRPRLPFRFMGKTFQGFVPKRQPELATRIGNLINAEFNSLENLEEKIANSRNLEKITPEIEKHIDHFLRVKLKDAMPMVAMFVGDRTINQMKEIFMTEMGLLFPVIMSSYVKELQKDLNIGETITRKLALVPASKIELFILQTLGKEFRYVQIVGTLLGFFIGAFQVIFTLLIRS